MSNGHRIVTRNYDSAGRAFRKRVTVTAVFCALAVAGLAGYFVWKKADPERAGTPVADFAAEIVSCDGIILVRTPGRSEWREVKAAAKLRGGDLVQTDSSSEACIRYRNGSMVFIQPKTIFAVRNASDDAVIRVSPQEMSFPPGLLAVEKEAVSGPDDDKEVNFDENCDGGSRPSLEIKRIVPFGRSLELIGNIEAGNSLSVNDETVHAAGDGSFKHFTKPFPGSDPTVSLVFRVTDLAGRTRTLEATHDFNPQVGGKQ